MSGFGGQTLLPRTPLLSPTDPDLRRLYTLQRYYGALTADPDVDVREGEMWIRSDLDPAELRAYVGGAPVTLSAAGGGSGGSVAWGDVTGKPSQFPPTSHLHPWTEITATPTTLAGYGITDGATDAELAAHEADTTAVHGIANTALLIVEGDARLTDARTPLAHAASHQSGGTDALDLDSIAGVLDASKLYGEAAIDYISAPLGADFGGGVVDAGRIVLNNPTPITVQVGSATIANLSADLLDGESGAYYLAYGNLTGVPSTFAPSAHAASHGSAGGDAVSLNASQVTAGTLDDARIPSGVARYATSGPFTGNAVGAAAGAYVGVVGSGGGFYLSTPPFDGWSVYNAESLYFENDAGTLIELTVGGDLWLTGAARPDSVSANSYNAVDDTQLVGARRTGWGVASGTAERTAFATYTAPTISTPPTQAEVQAIANHVQILSRRAKALIDDLHTTAGHGLIGT